MVAVGGAHFNATSGLAKRRVELGAVESLQLCQQLALDLRDGEARRHGHPELGHRVRGSAQHRDRVGEVHVLVHVVDAGLEVAAAVAVEPDAEHRRIADDVLAGEIGRDLARRRARRDGELDRRALGARWMDLVLHPSPHEAGSRRGR